MTLNYKKENQQFYDTYAGLFEQTNRTNALLPDTERFLASLLGKHILDLGSGPGRDALFFRDRGYDPLCFDLSSAMVRRCREQGLDACLGDFEHLPFADASFDGVWACASLIHTPKGRIPHVLDHIRQILRPNGSFYLRMRDGFYEGWVLREMYPDLRRFSVECLDQELRPLLQSRFSLAHASRDASPSGCWLSYLCRKEELSPIPVDSP